MPQQTLSSTSKRATGLVACTLALTIWLWAYKPPVLRDNALLRKFLKVQFISYAGTWLQWPAISILIYEMTGSSAALTVSVLLGILPCAIVSFLGGHFADRYPTRKLLLGSQIALALQAGVLCALHTTGTLQVWHLYTLQALSSAISGIAYPAQEKFTVELVGKKQIKDALAVNAVCWNIAWMGAPPLAGFIIGLGGVSWAFFGNAISYFPIIVYLLRRKAELHALLAANADVPTLLPESTAHAPQRIRWQGIKYIATTPTIWLTLLISSVVYMFYTNGGVLQPLIGLSLGGVHGYAMISASNGLGCLLGAFVLLRMRQRTIRGLLISIALMGTLLIAFGLAPVLGLAMAMMALATIPAEINRTGIDVVIQSNVPLELQGRISGIKQGIMQICVVLSDLGTGFFMVPALGAHYASAGSSVMGLVGIAVCWVIFRRLHRAGKLEKVEGKEIWFK